MGNRSSRAGAGPWLADGAGVKSLSLPLAWWLRSAFSLALAAAILGVALPVALGGGTWNGGVDPAQFF